MELFLLIGLIGEDGLDALFGLLEEGLLGGAGRLTGAFAVRWD